MTTRLYVGLTTNRPPSSADLQHLTPIPGVASIHGYIDDHKAQQRRFLAQFRRPTRGD